MGHKKEMAKYMSVDMAPNLPGTLLVLGGFAGWVIMIVLIILKIGSTKKIVFVYLGSGALLFLIMWLLGLKIA